MKVWPIDPLVPRNLRLEVPEKLPQGLTELQLLVRLVPGPASQRDLVRLLLHRAGSS